MVLLQLLKRNNISFYISQSKILQLTSHYWCLWGVGVIKLQCYTLLPSGGVKWNDNNSEHFSIEIQDFNFNRGHWKITLVAVSDVFTERWDLNHTGLDIIQILLIYLKILLQILVSIGFFFLRSLYMIWMKKIQWKQNKTHFHLVWLL